jgi:hypothetical protein
MAVPVRAFLAKMKSMAAVAAEKAPQVDRAGA